MNLEHASVGEITAKLDTLIRLLALSVAPATIPLTERAARLQRAGMGPKDIAMVCDSTPNAVSVALSKRKRGGTSVKKSGKEG